MRPNDSISLASATFKYCFYVVVNHIRRGNADMMITGGIEANLIVIGLEVLLKTELFLREMMIHKLLLVHETKIGLSLPLVSFLLQFIFFEFSTYILICFEGLGVSSFLFSPLKMLVCQQRQH